MTFKIHLYRYKDISVCLGSEGSNWTDFFFLHLGFAKSNRMDDRSRNNTNNSNADKMIIMVKLDLFQMTEIKISNTF